MSRPARWFTPLLLVIGNAAPLVAQVITERPPPGATSPTIVPPGPSWTSAAGFIPTRIIVKWASVPNAVAYQLYRSSPSESRRMAYEMSLDMLANFREMETGYYYNVNWPVDETSTYTYDLQAVFIDAAGSRTLSTPSPSASGKSAPWLAPANVKYTITLLAATPGKVTVNLSWDAVPNAAGYAVTFVPTSSRTLPLPVTTVFNGTKFAANGIEPKSRYDVCLSTIYRPEIRNDQIRTCIPVKT